MQIERLNRALRLANARIAQGDLNGVYAMTKLMPLVLTYEKFEQETSETMRENTISDRHSVTAWTAGNRSGHDAERVVQGRSVSASPRRNAF